MPLAAMVAPHLLAALPVSPTPAEPDADGQREYQQSQHHAVTVGRYRVSPLVRAQLGGGWSAGASIRSGRGSASTDRVLRFDGSFASEPDARAHAQLQALHWLTHTGRTPA